MPSGKTTHIIVYFQDQPSCSSSSSSGDGSSISEAMARMLTIAPGLAGNLDDAAFSEPQRTRAKDLAKRIP